MSAMPRSDDAPATRTSSRRLMDAGPDLRFGDGLAFAVDDRRLDLEAPERIAQVRDVPLHGQAVPDERRRLHFHVDPVEQGVFSRQVHADQLGIERRGEQAEGHPSAEPPLAGEVVVEVQGIVVAGNLGEAAHRVVADGGLELGLETHLQIGPEVLVHDLLPSFSMRSAMSPTFFSACSSPSANLTRYRFSMATTRFTCASESQPSTFDASVSLRSCRSG